MANCSGGKKGERTIRLIELVGKSVNFRAENRVGGRKWEELTGSRFAVQVTGFRVFPVPDFHI